MQLNDKQLYAMEQVIAGNNIFIDGPGGVGKSVLVREIKNRFDESTVFLAPTGIAALNIDGATIHSTFKFSHSILTKSDHAKLNKKTEALFSRDSPVKRIVIDEIPMVRCDTLTAIDHQLRKIRRLNQPFGGLQVIVVGDFFQLPPVLVNKDMKFYENNGFTSAYCFSGETWSSANFKHIVLDKIMRQSDETLISNLMSVRNKSGNWKSSIDYFNQIGKANRESVLDEDPVFLCTTNKMTSTINEQNYSELEGDEVVSFAEKTGKFNAEPSPYELKLKYGTKVLITANTNTHKNGQVGYVIGFVGKLIKVLIEDTEETIFIEKHKWEDVEYSIHDGKLSRDIVGTYTQYPLKYGWAITIHKAQGQTISHAMIDIGNGAFAPGQTYVALSRLRTAEGLALMNNISYSDVIVSPEIIEFYENDCRGIGLDI